MRKTEEDTSSGRFLFTTQSGVLRHQGLQNINMLLVVVAGKVERGMGVELGKFVDVGDRQLKAFLSDIFHFLPPGRCGHVLRARVEIVVGGD